MPKSVFDDPHFRNEEAAYEYVESILWATGRVCPFCGTVDRSGKLNGKTTRRGLYKCYVKECRKPFTVLMGTIFERSHIQLHIWLQAMHIMNSSKKGFSAHQFARVLGVDLKTAWFLGHRIRECMKDGGVTPMGGEGVFLELDESFLGGREKNKHAWKRKDGRQGGAGKMAVVSLIERDGRARSFHVPNVSGSNLREIIEKNADKESDLRTDEAKRYWNIGKEFASHEMVFHSLEEYVRGDAHINTAENYFSILKRGIYGCYFHVSEAHLSRYLSEFDFRHSNRSALGIDDVERTKRTILGAAGRRLTYKPLTGRA